MEIGPAFLHQAARPIAIPSTSLASPLTDAACATAPSGWLLNKGAGWWDGSCLNTLDKHHEPPNSACYDCITYQNPGWKAARSLHALGVNVLLFDGASRSSRTPWD